MIQTASVSSHVAGPGDDEVDAEKDEGGDNRHHIDDKIRPFRWRRRCAG
jgi:hypothetical protein